ncbi:MAG: hypothetical protein M1813_006230 [Trichoglossum hirsutum]|nr:MAG: hypothetical protein M1813_006230 [Trichoglossum hirsutum]
MQPRAQWYEAERDDWCLDPAREAFQEAVSIFSSTITVDKRKQILVQQAASLEDLQCAIIDARSKYDAQHKNHKISSWLAKFSYRIRYYGNIMDVLVQHHPEYVSLAWGAMKMLFILVENHAKSVKTLAKGLSQIADSLPRVELATILYPTKRMRQAVAELYSHIIRFFIRAQHWYQQSKLRHAWDSLARPVELYYNDLIQDIDECTKEVDNLAMAGARAEQRDIHLELRELSKKQEESETVLLELRRLMISYQSTYSSAFLDTNQRLTDLQLNQIMDYVSSACKIDSIKSRQYCAFTSNRQGLKSRSGAAGCENPFWLHSKFTKWKSQRDPALIMVKGDYKNRFAVRYFCVNVVQLLRKNKVPVIWALKTFEPKGADGQSVIDVVKDLVCQALRLNISLHTERSLSLCCAQFRAADTPEQWFDLLAMAIAALSQLYILVDIEAVDFAHARRTQDFSWISAFLAIFQNLSSRQCTTRLKVVLVSYGSAAIQETKLAEFQGLVVFTRYSRPGALRHGGKVPSSSQYGYTADCERSTNPKSCS